MDFRYIDGIQNVTIANGMTYITLGVVQPPTREGGSPQLLVAGALVLSVPNYVRLCAEMANNLKTMQDKGLIALKPMPNQVQQPAE
ncbi:MAG: hypothetical protein EKK41_12390 [Hyphomicrobiales bacterium]|nr:MAG: hypothetical protein EKK41_12390 [Hyphomicrobiales bacterium]